MTKLDKWLCNCKINQKSKGNKIKKNYNYLPK